MIYCVWYPSGGFEHFINAILSLYGKNFMRPKNSLEFSSKGDSHALDLVAPPYFHNPVNYYFKFDPNINYSVLIDNGINDQSDQFRSVFPKADVIKICYGDISWPVVARTIIEKAMSADIATELSSWANDNWAVREKYFLFLRDHNLRSAWRPSSSDFNLYVDHLFEYKNFYTVLESCGVELDNFESKWQQWRQINAQYIDPVETAHDIVDNLKHSQDLSNINDIWTQAVVYYFIWTKFKIEVPHNDYANWFTNTKEIVTMLTDHGVYIDTD